MSDRTNEREALDEGLGSDFWKWFTAHVEQEWGANGARYQQAVEKAAAGTDEGAIHVLRMTIFAKKEIERLLQAPGERLKQLRYELAQAGPPSPSRRGPGL